MNINTLNIVQNMVTYLGNDSKTTEASAVIFNTCAVNICAK